MLMEDSLHASKAGITSTGCEKQDQICKKLGENTIEVAGRMISVIFREEMFLCSCDSFYAKITSGMTIGSIPQ